MGLTARLPAAWVRCTVCLAVPSALAPGTQTLRSCAPSTAGTRRRLFARLPSWVLTTLCDLPPRLSPRSGSLAAHMAPSPEPAHDQSRDYEQCHEDEQPGQHPRQQAG
jgi:hypothetical protein